MAKRKCLVAGGAGFLGSHLCEKLLRQGNEVVCVDNFSSGTKENIASFFSDPKFSFIEHDICHTLYVDAEEIYNLASFSSARASQNRAIYALKTNVLGALNMLELAKRNRAKILQASSFAVYGNSCMYPQKEEDLGKVDPIGVRACFEEGKRAAETLFFDFYREHKLPIKVVRLFDTYGPRMSEGLVFQYLQRALEKEPILIQGKKEQLRTFCYVEDVVEALVLMMKSEQWVLGPVNIGSKEEYSMEELAKMILKETDSPSSIQYEVGGKEDAMKIGPDITFAKKWLNWEPKVSFSQGLKETVAYLTSSLQNSSEKLKEEDAFLSL